MDFSLEIMVSRGEAKNRFSLNVGTKNKGTVTNK
jgi:hypothetical protein